VQVRLRRANFQHVDLQYTDFSHADVSGATMGDASLSEATWHRVITEQAERPSGLLKKVRPMDQDLAEAEDWTP
jgi:uncharacterized protein YjbI with pentapeptide repeats